MYCASIEGVVFPYFQWTLVVNDGARAMTLWPKNSRLHSCDFHPKLEGSTDDAQPQQIGFTETTAFSRQQNKPSHCKQNDVHSPSFTKSVPCLTIKKYYKHVWASSGWGLMYHIMHCSFCKIKSLLRHWKANQPHIFNVFEKSTNKPPPSPTQLSVNLLKAHWNVERSAWSP